MLCTTTPAERALANAANAAVSKPDGAAGGGAFGRLDGMVRDPESNAWCDSFDRALKLSDGRRWHCVLAHTWARITEV